MGAPTSAILAETFIQHMEHKHRYPILKTQEIISYYTYVDDILMTKTNNEQTTEFNNIQPSIKFTTEKEQHKEINCLDITIHCKDKRLEFSICRKPTQTDIIISNSSCHPHEHKVSGIKYLLNQLNTHPITKKSKQTQKTLYIPQKTNITRIYLRNYYHNHKNKTYTKNQNTTKQNGPLLHIVEKKTNNQAL
jgi:hypothetical protein